MPGITVGAYPGDLTAGTEVSSTFEGRHVTVTEQELIHPKQTDGLVNKGDPVIVCDAAVPGTYGNIVGVAFTSAAAAGDFIAIDTEGIWNLTVYAEDDAGGSNIEIGDCLYIRAGSLPGAADADGTGDAEISKMNDSAHQIFFGKALGSMVAGGSGVIAVKVHSAPWPEQEKIRYATCPDGAYEYGHHWVGIHAGGRSTGVAGYFAAQLSGVQDEGIYGGGIWVEPQATFDGTGGTYLLVAWDEGMYAGGGSEDITANWVVCQNMAIDLGANPARLDWFRVNAAASSGTAHCVIAAANPTSVAYHAAITEADTPIGYVPMFDIVGIGVCYVRLYADYD